jgi:hypothetical protein
MIRESEVLDLLGNTIPDINPELEKLANAGNVYKTIQCFADFTRNLVGSGNLQAVKHCINLAEKMLDDGNNAVKNAIENVFLHTLSPVLDLGDSAGVSIKKMLKGSLRKEYSRQVCGSGI